MLEQPDPDTEAVDKVITPTSIKEQEEKTRESSGAWPRRKGRAESGPAGPCVPWRASASHSLASRCCSFFVASRPEQARLSRSLDMFLYMSTAWAEEVTLAMPTCRLGSS